MESFSADALVLSLDYFKIEGDAYILSAVSGDIRLMPISVGVR